jgi:hypothetical protein
VLAPVSIAVLMILWGTLVTQASDRIAEGTNPRWTWAPGGIGIALALGVFMTDALRALPDGRDAIVRVLPAAFNWPLFSAALVLIATPVAHLVYREISLRYPRRARLTGSTSPGVPSRPRVRT